MFKCLVQFFLNFDASSLELCAYGFSSKILDKDVQIFLDRFPISFGPFFRLFWTIFQEKKIGRT